MMEKRHGIDIIRNDALEDCGFVDGRDPFEVLIERHGRKFLEYREQWNKASNFELETAYPLQLDFELNDTCNLRCPMCTWSVENNEGKQARFFPFEKFKEIILDGVPKGLRALDMSFVNEPLLRKDLPEFIKFARENGIVDVAFNTNATALTAPMTEALLDSGLTRIQFSLDAHSTETYNKVRPGGNYEKVKHNILHFLKRKEERKVESLLTAATFVIMSLNEHEVTDFVSFWRGKVDYIILREYTTPYGPSQDEFEDKSRLFAAEKHIAREFRCNKPWQRMIVRVDGTLIPCCTFFGPLLPMGNLYEQGIQEVWQSEKMRGLRSLHKRGDYMKNKVCHECAVSSTVDFFKKQVE